MELLDQVRAALGAPEGFTTARLNELNQACGRDTCHRRERILHQLQKFLTANAIPMSASSTTHKFKKDFAKAKANIEVNSKAKQVTADNLTDEDVPLLQQYGYGHLLEELAKPEAPADGEDEDGDDSHGNEPRTAESLGKLKKDALHLLHTEVVGASAKSDAKKDELIAAILAADTPKD